MPNSIDAAYTSETFSRLPEFTRIALMPRREFKLLTSMKQHELHQTLNATWLKLFRRFQSLGFNLNLSSEEVATSTPNQVMSIQQLLKAYKAKFHVPNDAPQHIQTLLFIGWDIGQSMTEEIIDMILQSMLTDGQIDPIGDGADLDSLRNMVTEITRIGAQLRRADRSN